MRNLAPIVAVVFVLAASPLLAEETIEKPQPTAEHKKLELWVGKWTGTGEMKSGPFGPGGPMTWTEECSWFAGAGFNVVCKSSSDTPMGPAKGLGIVGYHPECPGGYGELMLLDEDLMLEIPADVDLDLASLVEPLAVGIEHARAGEVAEGDVPLVIGCGAIGLGVIAGLRLQGVAPIVASDPDPRRRALALEMGADVVVDPREASPYQAHPELGGRAPNVVFECVGKTGMLNAIVDEIGFGGRIVMGGFCLEPEEVYVPTAQTKRLRIHFACGETPDDMIAARDAIVGGAVDLRPWLGEGIGLSGVADALNRMSDPAEPIRRVVDPTRE